MTASTAQRAILSCWFFVSLVAVGLCWFLGYINIGRAEDVAGGFVVGVCILPALPAIAALVWTTFTFKRSRQWPRFGAVFSGLVLASVLSVASAGMLLDHERSLQRHAGEWWSKPRASGHP